MKEKQQGILFIILAGFFFASMSFFVRLSGDLPTMEKAFFRNAVAVLVAAFMLARTKEGFHVQKGSWPDLLMRSFFGTVGLICNFYAVDHMNIADANILNKLSPFFAILMSYFILKEKANKVEWACVVAAFSCLCTLPFLIAEFRPMKAVQLLCLLMAGVSAAGGQIFITKAYTKAPAKEISVFDYTQVLFAALLGFVFFGQIPDWMSLVGYLIIIGSAIFKWNYLRKE